MRHTKPLFPILFLLLIALSSCGTVVPTAPPPAPSVTPQPDEPAPEVSPTSIPVPTATVEALAALVNGEAIGLVEYEREVARYEASMVTAGQNLDTTEGQAALAQGRQWVLDLMVEQVLIEQQATQQGVVVTDADLDATIAALRGEIGEEAFNGWLAQEGMSPEEMRERLRGDMVATEMANRVAEAVPSQAEHVHARHIVVATEAEARQILGQLQAGGDFAALARMYSQDISTRDLGGDLGFFPVGVLTSKEVEAAAFSLQPGQLSDVVPSELGYHIVQVVERLPDQEVAPENLRLLRDLAVREWLDQLRSAADIRVFVTPDA